ncbi:MAG: DEAD/DEAH box helicase [Spirochaetales bacterium]|nr:DEAD/DEAH box helicase [Spirochaetales bacterium]
MSLSWIDQLRQEPRFVENVVSWKIFPPRKGSFLPLPEEVHPRLKTALEALGITELYSHQRRTWDLVRERTSVCLITPTASGKTLSYNLPILQKILEKPETRALYLFPTKALSQDQQSVLNEISLSGPKIKVATYDGDTPVSLRASAKQTGQIIITNPDMLHSGILPNHPKWITFLKNLEFVVIDELHSYRGVFGSHLANVIARLRRILNFYGSNPVFICCSATLGNPGQLAKKVTGLDITLIDENGSPAGEKHLITYNPPLVDRVQGIRKSTVNEAQKLGIVLLKKGIKTIVFARSRVRVELIAGYMNENLRNIFTDNQGIRVESYRGGYLPNERRDIERGLREGTIHGVVSTNALELGIDIGGLDASILAGYPGSIASVWQQSGRAGRSGTSSVAILVAGAAPLDQYIVNHPEYFENQAPEAGYINPHNPFIRTDHIRCAAFELPFSPNDTYFPDAQDYLELLTEDGTLRFTQGRYYWASQGYPAEGVSLRSAVNENIVIIDTTRGKNRVLGEMDRPSAKELIFPRAVYLHRGVQFAVLDLNLEERRCYVEESTLNYYTDAVTKTDLHVLTEDSYEDWKTCHGVIGDVLVRSQATKFKKLKFHTHENIGYGEIFLPEEEMHTRSAILLFPPGTRGGDLLAQVEPEQVPALLARVGYLLRQVAPAFLLCDPGDIRTSERLRDPHFDLPALFFYDAYPGGTGLAEGFLENFSLIARAALEQIRDCHCADGCPSCIGPRSAELEIIENPKPSVLSFLRSLGEL